AITHPFCRFDEEPGIRPRCSAIAETIRTTLTYHTLPVVSKEGSAENKVPGRNGQCAHPLLGTSILMKGGHCHGIDGTSVSYHHDTAYNWRGLCQLLALSKQSIHETGESRTPRRK